jgi:hypothetical protein
MYTSIRSLRRRYATFHTCNTDGNLLLWTVFGALRFELSLYERSGRLIFGSGHLGRRF